MASLARSGSYACRDLALAIRSQNGCNSVSDCIVAFDRWLRDVFMYRREQDEVVRTVPFMLNDYLTTGGMEGDCDDMAVMGCSLFCASGIVTRLTAIKSQPGEFDHVFCEALDGRWVPVDPTEPPETEYSYYGITYQAV